jgi:hypothetical protein
MCIAKGNHRGPHPRLKRLPAAGQGFRALLETEG